MVATATALGLALTATHRVIDRVHHHSAHVRTPALPPGAPGFPGRNVHVLDISDLADRCIRILVDLPDLAGRHLHQRITGFPVVQDDLLACAARNLAAPTWNQFDIVNAG